MKIVDADLAKAEGTVKAGKFSDSVKSYSRCISFMMDSLRGGAKKLTANLNWVNNVQCHQFV